MTLQFEDILTLEKIQQMQLIKVCHLRTHLETHFAEKSDNCNYVTMQMFSLSFAAFETFDQRDEIKKAKVVRQL